MPLFLYIVTLPVMLFTSTSCFFPPGTFKVSSRSKRNIAYAFEERNVAIRIAVNKICFAFMEQILSSNP